MTKTPIFKKFVLVYGFSIVSIYAYNYSVIDLPKEHLPYYFANFPKIAQQCERDASCPYKEYLGQEKCWGYESGCKWSNQYSKPECPGDHRGWVKTKHDQQNTFYTQADFGYIKQQLKELKVLCEPLFPHDSSLECSDHLRFCRGRNIMINFTSLTQRNEPLRYKMDVLQKGDIGGYCNFYQGRLNQETDHLSPLQSWAPEMRYFTRLQQRPIEEGYCDVIIEKPTFIMKIDATVNMYHHFCDFLNLYASLHLNASSLEAFSTNVHVLMWETYTYTSAFKSTWDAFTEHPIWDLKTFRGDVVCFKNIVFPLLPRMIFGLYYNTPIIYGCEKSGLFRAFSQHVLHRLKIPLRKRNDTKLRITLLSRDTKYRRILNEQELIKVLQENEDYLVQRVVYNRDVSFKRQLEITRNSDILIGIHGAGLTHLLFLPDWAAVFELYNCEDPNCYKDLTRLRGLKYVTWEKLNKLLQEDLGKHPEGGAHAKFTNYSFDKKEFIRLVGEAVKHVRNHSLFKNFLAQTMAENHSEFRKYNMEGSDTGATAQVTIEDKTEQRLNAEYENTQTEYYYESSENGNTLDRFDKYEESARYGGNEVVESVIQKINARSEEKESRDILEKDNLSDLQLEQNMHNHDEL